MRRRLVADRRAASREIYALARAWGKLPSEIMALSLEEFWLNVQVMEEAEEK